MKLISDIINELVDSEKAISSPLLKTKVLASRLESKELLNWVNQELNGFEKSVDVPEYRKFGCNVIGDYINGRMKYTKQPVALVGLGEEIENLFSSINFMQSITSLENLAKGNKSGTLEIPFSAEMVNKIQNNIISMGNPYFQLINARKQVSVNAVVEIISIVRNRLLDFMLKVDSQFGNLTEIEELKTKTNELSKIMSQTIINTSGDGNIINTGNEAEIKAKIKITKGNTEELEKQLNEIGVDQSNTKDLLNIIDSEAPNYESQKFGSKVNSWIQTMVGKALDGSWNIGVGAAGTLLAEAIKKYYGM